MASAPRNYPVGSTNEEIGQVIGEMSKEILDSGGDINVVMRLEPIISLGQSELQKRILDNNLSITRTLHEEVRKQSESSERNWKASARVSCTAVIISVLSIVMAIYYSVQSNQLNGEWQKNQIELLQKLVDK